MFSSTGDEIVWVSELHLVCNRAFVNGCDNLEGKQIWSVEVSLDIKFFSS